MRYSVANPARHLLIEQLGNRDALSGGAMTSVSGLAAPLGRPVVRRDPRRSPSISGRGSLDGWRCVAAVLALGLGLSGVSPCLCGVEPDRTSDPHACCRHSASAGGGVPTDGTSVNASSTPCCTSQEVAGLAARLDDPDVLRHTLLAAVATATVPARHVVVSTVGASASSLQYFSPPRSTVLRI